MLVSYLLQGASLGLFAGANPGPFQAFLLSTSLKYGWRKALPAAAGPLLSDGPIILIVVFILARLPALVLNVIQVAGGIFVLYLAVQTFRSLHMGATPTDKRESINIVQAGLLNLLNPNPWLFWGLVGGPIITEAWQQSPTFALGFVGSFFVVFILLNMGLIVFFGSVGRTHESIQRGLTIASGVVLIGFGLYQIASVLFEYVII